MGRVSQAQAQENRQRIVDTASRLFREQGTHVSVADLMKAAGLTHGGFYKQFDSKEALIDEATTHAFGGFTERRMPEPGSTAGEESGRRAFIDAYLSVEHRDHPAEGCPVAGLAVDVARGSGGGEARRVYAEGVGDLAEWLADGDGDGIAQLSAMVGALVLARATKGSPLSEEILAAARAALAPGG